MIVLIFVKGKEQNMSDKLKIFLSGGMTGLTEEEASKWRTSFKLNRREQ